jgi:uncharacterized protein (UPF0261 family)
MERCTPDGMMQRTRLYAEKLDRAREPVEFPVSLRGWSSGDKPGSVPYDPEEDRVFFKELKACLTSQIAAEGEFKGSHGRRSAGMTASALHR